MQIDWTHFTPGSAALGGALIGLSALILALALGRIAGVSGIIASACARSPWADRAWRFAFLLGILAAPTLWALFAPLPAARIDTPPVLIVLAGLIVGFGSRLGSGCTSGHGVCGIARLSPRSIAATLTFMATGMLTVFVVRHLLG